MGCLSDIMPVERSQNDPRWTHLAFNLYILQQASSPFDGPAHARTTQCLPQRCLIPTDDRLHEILLKSVQYSYNWQDDTAEKDGVSLRGIRLPRQLIGSLLVLGINILHIC